MADHEAEQPTVDPAPAEQQVEPLPSAPDPRLEAVVERSLDSDDIERR